jgi:hypothetical protein
VPTNPSPDESYPARIGFVKGTFRLEHPVTNDTGMHRWIADFVAPLKPPTVKPTVLAIELQGNTITMASSLFPKVSFVADGRQYEIQTSQGQTLKTTAVLNEKQLTIKTTTETNHTLETVFSIQPNGKLKVSQSLFESGKRLAVQETDYLRVSDAASLDVFPIESPDRPVPVDTVLLKKGERIVAEVDSDISSAVAKEGDEFSLTVKEPTRFKGAKVKGHLSNIIRTASGDEVHLNFDVIILPDGASYRMPGKMELKGLSTFRVPTEQSEQRATGAAAAAAGPSTTAPATVVVPMRKIIVRDSGGGPLVKIGKGAKLVIIPAVPDQP